MAATLTKAMLEDLCLGNASFRVIPQTYDITDTSFDNADQFFTTEGTLTISGGEATLNGIKIDQLKTSIGEYVEFSDVTIAGSIPSTALEVCDFFYSKSKNQPNLTDGITASDGVTKLKVASGYDLNGKAQQVTVLLESASRKTAVIYTNTTFYASAISLSSVKTTPWTVPFNGIAKEATKDGEAGIIILKSA